MRRHYSTIFRGTSLFALACATLPALSHAALYVTTGQTGQQVQCDSLHTQYWTYSVTPSIPNVTGALFDMKDGAHTAGSSKGGTGYTITFTIIQGTYADYSPTTTTNWLGSITLQPTAFTQSYSYIPFNFATPVTLQANTTYTGVLSSNAPNAQDEAYFIKTGNLYLSDQNGNPVPGYTITPGAANDANVVPEPTVFAVLGGGSLAVLSLRKRPRRARIA